MAHFTSEVERIIGILYPGTDIADLTPLQSHAVTRYIARIRGSSSRVVDIPELLVHILTHIPIKSREPLREVCICWNNNIIQIRHPPEIRLCVPVSERTIHLGIAARDPSYIGYVRTQAEFNLLWPAAAIVPNFKMPPPRAEFVTPALVGDAFRITFCYGSSVWCRWILGLRPEAFILLRESIENLRDVVDFETMAEEMCRLSLAGTLDPRLIQTLHDYGYGECVTVSMINKNRINWWRSNLYIILPVCPELAIWKRIYCGWRLNEHDRYDVPRDKSVDRLEDIFAKGVPADKELAFFHVCQAYLGK